MSIPAFGDKVPSSSLSGSVETRALCGSPKRGAWTRDAAPDRRRIVAVLLFAVTVLAGAGCMATPVSTGRAWGRGAPDDAPSGDAGTFPDPGNAPSGDVVSGDPSQPSGDAGVVVLGDSGTSPATVDAGSVDPTDPSTHTQAEVCQRFRDSSAASPAFFQAGASGSCDPGTTTTQGVDDAVRRLNFYRWFTGLPSVSADAADNGLAQACAVVSAWNPATEMAHTPSPGAQCYTPDGASGAGTSNIGWGDSNAVEMVDGFVADPGNDTTLGHRRWCLYPPLAQVGVGLYLGGDAGYGEAGCLKVVSDSDSWPPPNPSQPVAYPPAGFVPVSLTQGLWSIAGGGLNGSITVTITRTSDGATLPTSIQPLQDGFGLPTQAWRLNGWSAVPGEDYLVQVTDGATTVSYHVRPVTC